ncbi:hypothetical protein E2C01_093276 [Portunus trituberculatus]|uniref:Uncharacterized protein n=1 Tax=Portunus trituberculatus TaxID=210409 RepID=A0A5B7JIK6_PORTR|nr:hypothetical protein [Portunus trituberculatus]
MFHAAPSRLCIPSQEPLNTPSAPRQGTGRGQ